MDYFKHSFIITPDNQDFREILVAVLGEIGFESFVENDDSVDAFIPSTLYSKGLLDDLNFEPAFVYKVTSEEIPDQNWNEIWEKNYFKPLVISGKCVVRAPFHDEYPHEEIEIVIEPNMAFGTGNHETTTMMMEYILENKMDGKHVLDMGCGTGILAILASKCGASSITAIDIDKWSYEGTIENSGLNGIKNITPILGDASAIPEAGFDIIFANIQKNIILSDMPLYHKALNAGGTIVVSGFYCDDLDDIVTKANGLGLKLKSSKENNKWCSACFCFSETK